jgi:hypothetical protein
MQSEMQARAISRIIVSGDWLTVREMADVADQSITNSSACISEWKERGLIFSIQFQGEDYYPSFALDPKRQFFPRPELMPMLTILANRSSWELAFWFDSPNGYLGGRRPKELLATEPENVLLAARMEAQGIGHG